MAGHDRRNAARPCPPAPPQNPGWSGRAPLWFYILRESELQAGGTRLGPVGGRIVAEVILGVLDADKASYLHAKPGFAPVAPIAAATGEFRMGDLIRFARTWPDALA